MSQTSTMTIRLNNALKDRLDRLATATQRSKSFLAAEAVREYVELNEWQLKEIQDAINEADAADFSSDAEVEEVFAKWRADAG